MSDKYKILFVCLGNICRSPAAEGIFRQMVEKRGLGEKLERIPPEPMPDTPANNPIPACGMRPMPGGIC